METNEMIVAKIKKLCSVQRLTRKELAKRAGVAESTVYSLLKGNDKNVSVETIKKLCKGLGITLGEFFSGM